MTRRLRLQTVTILLLGTFALSACQTSKAPSPGMGDPYPAPYNNPDISVLSLELQPWLAFQPATVVRSTGKPMSVQIPVRNMADRGYLIDYRYLFYDENGMEIEPAMGWAMQSLEPKQLVYLKANALDDRARTYRLEIKWSR